MIYSEAYILARNYNKQETEYPIKELNEFFINNYLDLFSDYQYKFGVSEDKLKILINFIIKYQEKYLKQSNIEINYKYIPKKKIRPFEIWYTKFILSQPYLFRILLTDFSENVKFNKIKCCL